MLLEDQHPLNKSIMAAVLGRPNAGKSSLINNLLGYDLSIVSNKPQTTRNSFHCVFTIDRTEVILVDTPGVHKSGQELNVRMNGQAQMVNSGGDINLLLLDASRDVVKECSTFLKDFRQELKTTWILFTKIDLVKEDQDYKALFKKIQNMLPSAERFFPISTLEGTNIHLLTGALADTAESGPHLYPEGHISNKNERFFATEYIREQTFKILKDELPYEIAVVIEDFQDAHELDDGKVLAARVSAAILVNRQSQRAIVVGSKGSNIKLIGMGARKKIEAMIGQKVLLNLHVKVSPKWFKNNYVLTEIGLPRVQESKRVWRKRDEQ